MDVIKELFKLQDIKYRDFVAKLIPTVDISKIIGIRTPILRRFAKDFNQSDKTEIFLKSLPHTYYEENNLHAYLLEQIHDFGTAITMTERFLPYIDNWSTCDTFCPKVFSKNADKLLPYIEKWLSIEHTYTKRYAISLIMRYFLDDKFDEKYLKFVADIHSDEYYINMMRAWFFATALFKQYNATVAYLENNILDKWTHNKTIQKAIESYRITKEQKEYLKTLKVK